MIARPKRKDTAPILRSSRCQSIATVPKGLLIYDQLGGLTHNCLALGMRVVYTFPTPLSAY